MVAWGEITGSIGNQADLNTALNSKANTSGTTFTGDVGIANAVLSGSTLFANDGIKIGDGAADGTGHVTSARSFFGNVPTFDLQDSSANYTEALRINQIYSGDPTLKTKWQGLYVFGNFRNLTANSPDTTEVYGINNQFGIFDPNGTPHTFGAIYGGFNVAFHDAPGSTINITGSTGRASLLKGNATTVRGAEGIGRTAGASPGTISVLGGVEGIIDVTNASTITTAAVLRSRLRTNVGTITNAYGVWVENEPIGGSGSRKAGLRIEPQTVQTPGNWTNVANIWSAGNVPNRFEGPILSTAPQGTAPVEVVSTTLCPKLNANFVGGQDLAALDNRYVSSASIMPRARQISANRFYLPAAAEISSGTSALPANTLVAVPFDTALQINGAAIDVTTAGPAGSFALLGFYACGSRGEPGALLEDAGAVPTNGIGIQTAPLSVRPIERPFWLAVVCSHAITIRAMAANAASANRVYGVVNFTTNTNVLGLSVAHGPPISMPTTFPAGGAAITTGYAIYARGA